MTSRQAGAAAFSYLEPDGQVPGAERHGVADMLRVVSRMSVVACPARAALHGLVHVDEMKVLLAVSELCQGRGLGIEDYRLFMAVEAELVVLQVEGCVKYAGKVLLQYPEVVGAVQVVACQTVMLFYRAMGGLVQVEVLLHVRYLAVGRFNRLVVAHHTGFDRLFGKLSHIIGDMGVMAGETLPLVRQTAMFHLDPVDPLFLVRVTGEAEVNGTFGTEVVFEIPGMRAVTVDAIILCRLVDGPAPGEGLGLVCVALETDGASGGIEQFGKISLVRFVTHDAAADRQRTVNELSRGHLLVVAEEAQIGLLGAVLVLVSRLVRVVTLRTHAVLHRLMDGLFHIALFVALCADCRGIRYLRELVFPLTFVTEQAVPCLNQRVYELVLAHGAMALVCNARVSGGKNRTDCAESSSNKNQDDNPERRNRSANSCDHIYSPGWILVRNSG